MHENLSKLRKSRIPLYKTHTSKTKHSLEICTLITLQKNKKMTIKEQVPS